MTSITTAVFKAIVGLLANKDKEVTADQMKDGDMTDPKFRELVVHVIDAMEGLTRQRDLLASISYFRQGVVHLFKLFEKAKSEEDSSVTALAEGVKNLKLTGLDDADKGALSSAKEGFRSARSKATEAFNNKAQKTSDRIQAMVVRVAATILRRADHLEAALTACKMCLEELHSMPEVQNSFDVEIEKHPYASQWNKKQHMEIISTVCQVNRLIYDVTQTVGKDSHVWIWPFVAVQQRLPGDLPIFGQDKVDPLRDTRVTKLLHELGMEHCSVTPWSFGQDGEEEHKLQQPHNISTSRQGQFIVSDDRGRNSIKVFDKGGKFHRAFCPPQPYNICDVVADRNGNIYALSYLIKQEGGEMELSVSVYDKEANLQRTFPMRKRAWVQSHCWNASALAVNDRNKVFVLWRIQTGKYLVDVYDTDGQFVFSFGEGTLRNAAAIVTDSDGRVMILETNPNRVHVLSEQGDHLFRFPLEGPTNESKMAFHWESEYVIVAAKDNCKDRLSLQIHTKGGKFVRKIYLNGEGKYSLKGISVTEDGHIAVSFGDLMSPYGKVIVV